MHIHHRQVCSSGRQRDIHSCGCWKSRLMVSKNCLGWILGGKLWAGKWCPRQMKKYWIWILSFPNLYSIYKWKTEALRADCLNGDSVPVSPGPHTPDNLWYQRHRFRGQEYKQIRWRFREHSPTLWQQSSTYYVKWFVFGISAVFNWCKSVKQMKMVAMGKLGCRRSNVKSRKVLRMK